MAILTPRQAQNLIPSEWRHVRVTCEEEIIFLGTLNILMLIQFWNYRAESLGKDIARTGYTKTKKDMKDRYESYVQSLLVLALRASEKPVFPLQRKRDKWVYPGVEVLLFPTDGATWTRAYVASWYRTGNAFVDFVDRPNALAHNGSGTWYGYQRPHVLKPHEWQYLQDNPKYADVWVRSCIGMPAFSPEEFRHALMYGTIA